MVFSIYLQRDHGRMGSHYVGNLFQNIFQKRLHLPILGTQYGNGFDHVFKRFGFVPLIDRFGCNLLGLLDGKWFTMITYICSNGGDNFFYAVI